ncbi:putative fatty acyl-CoA reductase CG5065 [Plodia interpunctella]|uniref:putative fatty acyl-CoA reductase CG5065 n=1 Tax=Plodia interpunctella TaxID=58824 RepID=UPI002367D14B|nr:putative fatty acyl-CoA reductase CG5065 [Plodia interpunctella]
MAPSLSVREYYADKTIFITGATGFVGKVLIEKILYSCPEVKKIYLLMRPKKGQSCKERLDAFVNCKVFDRIHNSCASRLEKLQVIPGDILAEDLGVSPEDRELLQRETQILFHGAACVRFDTPLREAVNMNTVGTKKVLDLADKMSQLEVFVHVSTSYCRCEVPVLEERLYPADHRPDDVMRCVSWMGDELLDHLQPKLIHPQPNTYAYTKNLTEDLVSQQAGKYPIVIARPSIVTAALREPLVGWVDNLNGPTGLLVGAGKGVIRTMHCNEDYVADVVPVDIVVNACILLAYCTALEKPTEVQICNITQSGVNPITWGGALDIGRVKVQEYPFSVCLWYPGGSPKSSWLQHQIAMFFTHLLPAYLVDLLMCLLGKKPFMVKIQKRVNYGLEVLQYYTTKEWHFRNDNFRALRKKVSQEDDTTFYTDLNEIHWLTYVGNYIKGAREYCIKEDPATIPQAKKLQKQLYYLDWITKIVMCSLCVYFLYSYMRLFVGPVSN